MADNIPNFKCAIPSTALNNALFGGQSAYTPLGPDGIQQTALANLGAGVRPNLLDNPYFTGGSSQEVGLRLPINQRGQTSASEESTFYLIDRWKNMANARAEISDAGYTFTPPSGQNGWFQQVTDRNTEDFNGKSLTLSALFSDGSFITGTVESWASTAVDIKVQGYGRLRIQPLSNYTKLGATFYHDAGVVKTYVAAKLEEGEGQTLAYQDSAGVWQLLPQPDMDCTAQLLRCQRYFIPVKTEGAYCGSVAASGAAGRFFIPTPVMMRADPVIQGAAFSIVADGANTSLSGASFTPKAFPNGVEIAFSGVSGLSPNQATRVYATTAGFLSAQL